MNDSPEYKTILEIINPETYQLETIQEIIGFDYDKYPIDSYVLCKYYQGDINLEKLVSEYEIPGDIKKCLVKNQQVSDSSDSEISDDREFEIIDEDHHTKNQ